MTVITLTFEKLGTEILAGIPEYVDITASSPAIIFYTLDGTLPTAFSTQFTGEPIRMPTNSESVTLSAVPNILDGYGNLVPCSIFSETYTFESTAFNRVRNLSFEGISYIYPGGLNIPYWYDADGYAKVFIDIPIAELEKQLIPSERNVDGSIRDNVVGGIIDRTLASETPTTRDDPVPEFSSPENNSEFFDPRALFITIDGREGRSLDDVLLINGPYMSLRNPEGNFSGLDFVSTGGTNYISGSFLRAYHNRRKGLIVYYYYDSNSNRWVKSIQNLPDVDASLLVPVVYTNPLVFKWNNFGRHQRLS